MAWAIGPVIDRGDIPGLCVQLATLVRTTGAVTVDCDVGRVVDPDAVTVDALARLRLTAGRLGCDLRIRRANRRLRDLVLLCGLAEWLGEPRGSASEDR